ncbi:fatty acid-binding protein-like [Rhynchophorus ferrugineus]|uniref:Uncharacterized protein n=1 Tax=Rhynchophorus ferrugineus TaxID=354439 RepID=A0A834IDD0_RHYFE|nr:hypothetical protein GWI33_009520 [Rhynchophorus ferrugineus]KAF7277371.1 hypothetical protein GWI33_008472 [Rhynchophorus ferrugineus]
MVQIVGSYEPLSKDNLVEYLKSFNVSEEIAQMLAASKSPVVISDLDSEKVTVTNEGTPTTFVFGKELDITLPTGQQIKTTVTIDGDSLTFKTVYADNASVFENKVYQFTNEGLTSTLVNHKNLKAVVQYKRL